MSSSIPKEVLYILDYENYLNLNLRMPAESAAWINDHMDLVDNAAKRESVLAELRPQIYGSKHKRKSFSARQKEQLQASFITRYTQARKMRASGDVINLIINGYRKDGISLSFISRVTGISVYGLKKRGIK